MKYFKHMSNMTNDPVIKRIKRKFGIKGYGLYNIILESISSQLEKYSPIPDLKETATDIADEWNEDIRNVEEMMSFMVDQNLFTLDIETGRIVCLKILKYLDEYLRKVPDIKNAVDVWQKRQKELFITDVRQNPTMSSQNTILSVSVSDNIPLEENRKEENRKEYIYVKSEKLDFPEFPPETQKLTKKQEQVKKMIPIVEMFNLRTISITGRKYKTDPLANYVYKTLKKWIDKYSFKDFETVTRVFVVEWDSEEMRQYIQIETLFNGKFEQRLDKAKALMAEQENK